MGFSRSEGVVTGQTCFVIVEERFGESVDSSQDCDLTRIGPLQRECQPCVAGHGSVAKETTNDRFGGAIEE